MACGTADTGELCVLLCGGIFTFLPGRCFEADSSSGFTIKGTLEVVGFWIYANLRRVCLQVFNTSGYFGNILGIEGGEILLWFCGTVRIKPSQVLL